MNFSKDIPTLPTLSLFLLCVLFFSVNVTDYINKFFNVKLFLYYSNKVIHHVSPCLFINTFYFSYLYKIVLCMFMRKMYNLPFLCQLCQFFKINNSILSL